MAKKEAFTPLLYLASIVFLRWWISLSFNKSLKSWITNWWDTRKSKTFLNDIQEKSILEQFIEVEELFPLDEMIKEYSETHLQKLQLLILNSWVQEFLYNLSDTIKAFSILLLTDLFILDTIFKYWIFCYLNRVPPSLVVIYHSMND
ncbi:hypothetical protein V6Z11_D06G120900 [Gossypium hirsutum]